MDDDDDGGGGGGAAAAGGRGRAVWELGLGFQDFVPGKSLWETEKLCEPNLCILKYRPILRRRFLCFSSLLSWASPLFWLVSRLFLSLPSFLFFGRAGSRIWDFCCQLSCAIFGGFFFVSE